VYVLKCLCVRESVHLCERERERGCVVEDTGRQGVNRHAHKPNVLQM